LAFHCRFFLSASISASSSSSKQEKLTAGSASDLARDSGMVYRTKNVAVGKNIVKVSMKAAILVMG
jgi:hypothetical protein